MIITYKKKTLNKEVVPKKINGFFVKGDMCNAI